MDDSKQEIMEATHSALKKHGYTDLSIQKIADEFKKSKSLLYHHYDGKDDLLLDFMEYALEQFSECCMDISSGNQGAEEALKEKAFIGFRLKDKGLASALIEIRAQGIKKKEYSKRFHNFSEEYRDQLEEILDKGQEKNRFKEFETRKVAEFIDATNKEAMFNSALGRSNQKLEEELKNYIQDRILR